MAWHTHYAERSWAHLWAHYIVCSKCAAIRRIEGNCPVCGEALPVAVPSKIRLADGEEIEVWPTYNGAEGRYEDWLYLQMLQREWQRPAPECERFNSIQADERPSARAALVLLFWSYFETRLERLLNGGMQALPAPVRKDLLDRYSSVGARLHRLYKLLFDTTYFADLGDLGFPAVAALLEDLHGRRNEFAHGNPKAINDATVSALVDGLKDEHEAWIAAFNRRATGSVFEPTKIEALHLSAR